MEMNILEDASSLRYGCLVHYYRVCGVSAFSVDTQSILQRGIGFLRDCLRRGKVSKLAGLPTPRVKEVFILFFSKHIGFFMPDKCILEIKIHPMISS